MEQYLLTHLDHLRTKSVFDSVRVSRSFVVDIVFCRQVFVLWSFCVINLRCHFVLERLVYNASLVKNRKMTYNVIVIIMVQIGLFVHIVGIFFFRSKCLCFRKPHEKYNTNDCASVLLVLVL